MVLSFPKEFQDLYFKHCVPCSDGYPCLQYVSLFPFLKYCLSQELEEGYEWGNRAKQLYRYIYI